MTDTRYALASLSGGEQYEGGIEGALQSERVRVAFGRRKMTECPEVLAEVLRAAAPLLTLAKDQEIKRLQDELWEAKRRIDHEYGTVVNLRAEVERLTGELQKSHDSELLAMRNNETWRERVLAAEARVAKLREALKEATKLCWCGGTGRIYVDGNMYDPCTDSTCAKARALLSRSAP